MEGGVTLLSRKPAINRQVPAGGHAPPPTHRPIFLPVTTCEFAGIQLV